MTRQLISSAEAVPAKDQHDNPCSDCPMSRKALPGWLGGIEVGAWVMLLHSDAKVGCHVLEGAQCAGAATYRANVGKRPRDRSVLLLAPNEVACFKSPDEFVAHHRRKL